MSGDKSVDLEKENLDAKMKNTYTRVDEYLEKIKKVQTYRHFFWKMFRNILDLFSKFMENV